MAARRLIAGLFFSFFLSSTLLRAAPRPVRIGLVDDGPYYYSQECWARFKEEMAAFAGEEFRFIYPEEYTLVDNWDPAAVAENCRTLLQARDVDIIMGMGMLAPAFFFSQTDLAKPVVLFGEFDLEMVGLEDESGRSRIENLTFQVDRGRYLRDVEKIDELARGGKIVVLVDPELFTIVPGLKERGREAAAREGLTLDYAYYGETPAATVAELPPGTGFIYLTPSRRYNTRPGIKSLLEELGDRSIPTFALEGRTVVELGALAGLASGDAVLIARNNALKVYEILKGEDPREQSVYFRDKQRFTLNMATARRIDFYPDFDLMLEADLLNPEDESGPLISPREAVEIALENNLSYQIASRELEESGHSYRKVLANLFPQLGAELNYQRIDTDRAQASLGIQPRWESAAGLQLDQLLFDYSVWKSVTLARLAVAAAERDLEISALDTARDALLAYFSTLQARELVRVQAENLEATRNHLEIARVRLEQEAGSREEVLRLESEYKRALSDLLDASFDLRKASLLFNETLNRPQEAPFRLKEFSPDREEAVSIFSSPETDRLLTNQRDSDRLRNYLVAVSERYSPEIKLARLSVEIAEEDLSRARSSVWSPTIGARAEYRRRLGEEVWNPDGSGGGGWSGSGPYPDDEEWALVGYVSVPIWKGGSNWAEWGEKKVALRKARQSLRLREQATALEIRSAYFDLSASSTRLELDRARERLAAETLKLVEDKYRQGALPLIDLLDAQSEHVNAQAGTVSSFYASVTDLVELERMTGFLEHLAPPAAAENFLQDMTDYLKESE